MVEHAEIVATVHKTTATSKELAEKLMAAVANSKNAQVTLDVGEGHAIASQLRITANLIEGLLEENTNMINRVNELIERLPKK